VPLKGDFNVFTQKKFAEKIGYIHTNPVTRSLVEKPEDWPWSSFPHWSTGEPGRIEIESHWTCTRRDKASTLLPAECRVLVSKPGECVLKML
jgi:putative transposase